MLPCWMVDCLYCGRRRAVTLQVDFRGMGQGTAGGLQALRPEEGSCQDKGILLLMEGMKDPATSVQQDKPLQACGFRMRLRRV